MAEPTESRPGANQDIPTSPERPTTPETVNRTWAAEGRGQSIRRGKPRSDWATAVADGDRSVELDPIVAAYAAAFGITYEAAEICRLYI